MKEIINCNIPISFPTKPNANYICFTPESLKNIGAFLENAPVVKDENENTVGILSGNHKLIENENEIIMLADAKLWNDLMCIKKGG